MCFACVFVRVCICVCVCVRVCVCVNVEYEILHTAHSLSSFHRAENITKKYFMQEMSLGDMKKWLEVIESREPVRTHTVTCLLVCTFLSSYHRYMQ